MILKVRTVVVLGGAKWWLEEGASKALVMFCFLKVLVTGLSTVGESSLSWVHLTFYETVVCYISITFFFFKKGQWASFKKQENQHSYFGQKFPHFRFVRKNKDVGSVPLL